MLRGAISGFGEVAAQAHIAGWRTRPGVAIVAIHDPASARRHQAINLLKNVRVYDDLDLMLDGEALDFVDIASPPAFHTASVRKALAAGAHVLVEKPACFSSAELDGLAALAAARARVLMCVHNWKYAPAYRRAHELIAAGRLGDLRHVSLTRLRRGPAGAGGSAVGGERWRLDPKTGGGILIDHGWHVFYLMQWLMGGDAPARVAAHLGRPDGSRLDDLADLRIEFPRGRIAAAHLSWRSPVRRTSAMIYGAEAMLEIEGDRIALTDRSGASEDLSVSDLPDDSYHAAWFAGMAADFERAIDAGCDGSIVGENRAEVRAAVALTEGSMRSAEAAGARVPITLQSAISRAI
ncbi:MAG TPA: Gfo/Idh/MocA family oxidoreductase [Candidatus Binataceae bacterium]|nr:Gfo/Idh/MocA family oxidoreductase [Candidatus Binataceae bacterium]